jgi:uncharacterized protein (TIGR03086 family)
MITADHHLRAMDAFDELVSSVPDRSWDHRVPSCPAWDVRTLVTHVAEETLSVGLLVHGEDPERAAARVGRLISPDDPLPSWRRAVAYTRSVLDQSWLGDDVRRRDGTVRASDYVAEVCCATVIHTWDLAISIDADPTIDPVLVASCTDWFDALEGAWRERDLIGPPVDVADDAGAHEQLLARAGRSRSSR